nr:GPGG-motif small membrane protein [Motilibacter aurantiacus]
MLWVLAVVLVVAGIATVVRDQLMAGVTLVVLGLLVAPGIVTLTA